MRTIWRLTAPVSLLNSRDERLRAHALKSTPGSKVRNHAWGGLDFFLASTHAGKTSGFSSQTSIH